MTDGVAIAHRSYEVDGGGEHVAEELSRTFDAPLYTGYADGETDVDRHELWAGTRIGGLLRRNPPLSGLVKMALWSRAEPLHDYETIITSGPEPLWYQPSDGQTMIHYCHSPMRWIYDQYHSTEPSVPGAWFADEKRRRYESAAKRPDYWIANSDLVARRLRQHLSIDGSRVRVVYPPVDTQSFGPEHAVDGDGGYYVTVGRLADHKHTDVLVQAFDHLEEERLVVAGDGPEREHLESMAPSNVEIAGYVSERRKRELLAGARAFVFAGSSEDFCMSTVEALASGTPVITVDEGFPPFQIGAHRSEGIRGYTFDRGGDPDTAAKHCYEAIRRFEREGVDYHPRELEQFAAKFDVSEFRRGVREIVREAHEQTRVQPQWDEQLQEIADDSERIQIDS